MFLNVTLGSMLLGEGVELGGQEVVGGEGDCAF